MSQSYKTTPLALVMLAYCILAILYAVLTPPWETPDEPAHYRYIAQLAERWRPPPDPLIRQKDRFCRDYPYISSNYEWYHPALGYLPSAVIYKIIELFAPYALPTEIPPLNPLFCPDPFTHPSLFLHKMLSPFKIWQNIWGILIIRIFSSIWGLAVVFVTYQVGRCLKMAGFEIVAAGWVAFLPQFIFISASVRNDTVANVVGAVLFLLAAQMQIFPEKRNRYALIMGLLLGIGILTKLTLAYLFPMALLAIILSTSRSPREWVRLAVLTMIPCLALVAIYYLAYEEAQAALLYTRLHLRLKPDALSWDNLRRVPPMLVDLFFARFGWANVVVPPGWIKVACGIWLVGGGSSFLQLARLLRKIEEAETRILILLLFGLLMALVGVLRYNLSHFQPQGRFLFPALVGWALLGTWGLHKALPKGGRLFAGILTISFMFIFSLHSLAILIATYY